MSFQGVLVDRARRVQRLVGHRSSTLGESEQVVQYGEWYKVRLSPPTSTEEHSANEAAEDKMRADLLMPKDFVLNLNDRVEIESLDMDIAGIWLIVGQPTLLRKKRTVLGKSAVVLKVTSI